MIISAQILRKIQPLKPFYERTVFKGVTYGLSSAGYDIRVAQELIFQNYLSNFNVTNTIFLLASSIEEFNIPNDILGIVHDKSTWARNGIAVQL